MATFYVRSTPLARGGGKAGESAVAAAAYRAGERFRDERTGRMHDHTYREDVMHREIVLPSRLADEDMSWALDRATLWNTAERAETRKDSRVARHYDITLPSELTHEQRVGLVRGFSRALVERHKNAVDFAIHSPVTGNEDAKYHAHLLATTREIRLDGFELKTWLEADMRQRRMRGLDVATNELRWVNETWARHANHALETAGFDTRIDHRSLAEQGIDREPLPHIPIWARAIEWRGERSTVADHIREQYAARVAARQERVLNAERVQHAQRSEPRAFEPSDLEAVRRQAREDWLRLRQLKKEPAAEPKPDVRREIDYEYGDT